MRSSGGLHDIKSSLPLQVALYFNGYYSVAFVIAQLLLLIYKGMFWHKRMHVCVRVRVCVCVCTHACVITACALLSVNNVAAVMLPYPTSAINLEVAFVFLFCIIEVARIHAGTFPLFVRGCANVHCIT
ncbi:hypothetical protein EON66_04095, partial [archaeon]